MFRNYFKTTFRFFLKNRTFSVINIVGLALGTLCCLYIVLYVQDQYSYDKHHKNAKDIYRITTTAQLAGGDGRSATTSPPVAPAMKRDFAEVEQFTRVVDLNLAGYNEHRLKYKDKSFYEKDAMLADSTFFNVFTYDFVYGSASKALVEPYTVVLLKPVADKLFAREDPLGKVIEIEGKGGKHDFTVTGVITDKMGKSHVHGNLFMTMNSGGIGDWVLHKVNEEWAGASVINSYVKLYPDANVAALEKKLVPFLIRYGAQQMKELGMTKQLNLQPVTSIHTTTGYDKEITETANTSFLNILLSIAVLIQLIACINFMNLTTARASKRAREVAVRKVIGAGKNDLVKQFMSESFLLSFISVLTAMPLLIVLLPYINQLTHADIHLSFLSNFKIWLLLSGIIISTGLVAGSYPAFYLSAFSAIKVIKGNFTNHISAAGIRRSLVVFQFVLSIILIAGLVIIYSQLNYIKQKDLGFEKDQKIVFSFQTDAASDKIDAFTSQLQGLADIKSVSNANNYPGQFAVLNDRLLYLAGGSIATAQDVQTMRTDKNYVSTLGIKSISGRDFRLYDSGKVLVNEAFVKKLGIKLQNAEGTKVYAGSEEIYEITGVLKDFNYNSLHQKVNPLMIMYEAKTSRMHNMIVAVNSADYKTLISKIEVLWNEGFPGLPFNYAFLDNEVQKQYETESTLANIINSFTLMAILISCLGLFGLVAFSAEQRKKEIGVRKVLGASVMGITQLLSKDFFKLIGIAIAVAIPIAWWAMNKWLQEFAYRITISWWMFALAAGIAILIASLTVSFQAIKAAIANPVKSLRT
jgi:putative ABC transport system permease protein